MMSLVSDFGRAVVLVACAVVVAGCGRGDDGVATEPIVYFFQFPDRDLPAELVFSEADRVGLQISDGSVALVQGPGFVLARVESVEESVDGTRGPHKDYCLVDEAVFRDLLTGVTEPVFNLSCFSERVWVHPWLVEGASGE